MYEDLMNPIRILKSWFITTTRRPSIKPGDRFEAVRNVRRTAIFDIRGPMTDGFKCEVTAGSTMVCRREPTTVERIVFYLWPEEPGRIERQHVPQDMRSSPDYRGFAIYWYFADIGDVLKRL